MTPHLGRMRGGFLKYQKRFFSMMRCSLRIYFFNLNLNEKQPSGPIELDLEAGNLVSLKFNKNKLDQTEVTSAQLSMAPTSLLEEKWTRTPPAIAPLADPRIVPHPHMYFRFTHKILTS